MKRYQVLEALDRIAEMNDAEIELNKEYIRKVAQAAYSLIKQQARKKSVYS